MKIIIRKIRSPTLGVFCHLNFKILVLDLINFRYEIRSIVNLSLMAGLDLTQLPTVARGRLDLRGQSHPFRLRWLSHLFLLNGGNRKLPPREGVVALF